jgi:hypothetical protein
MTVPTEEAVITCQILLVGVELLSWPVGESTELPYPAEAMLCSMVKAKN